jgi:Pyruvate/2-oxoacid:ferredoxin oxidoreductase gamma subunit
VEQEIIRVAQSMRRDGQEVASIWGKELPPIDPEQMPVTVPVNAIHPSIVARLTQHLLHDACPTANVSEQLSPEFSTLDIESLARIPFGTNGALDLLKKMANRVLCNGESDYAVSIDGHCMQEGDGKHVYVETWGEGRFLSDGINVIRDAVPREETRIILVWRNYEIGSALLTLVEAVLPSKNDDGKRVVEVSIDQGEEVDIAIEAASSRIGVTVIIVRDGEDPHFDLSRLSTVSKRIDALGFRPQHATVIPIDQMTPVRLVPIDPWKSQNTTSAMLLETSVSARWVKPEYRRWRISLRPILERAEVTRNKPPVRVVTESTGGLTPPKVIHGASTSWRIHIAGSRGDQPGVVSEILIQAGMQMEYELRVQCNNRFVGPGRRAWSQLLFTKKQSINSYSPLIGSIPWGEADVVLGWDKEEAFRALDQKGNLRVGSQHKTYAIVNTDQFEHQTSFTDASDYDVLLDKQAIAPSCKPDGLILRGFASLARYRFHNERLGDLVQLGMAFQLGYIPVTVDAIQVAVAAAEKNGYARSIEAFDFGRRIANDSDSIWKPIKEESHIDLERLEKRCVRDLHKQGRRGKVQAEVVKRLLRQCRQSLSGLFETASGRQSMTDLFNGIRRCMLWGGEETAIRFVNLVCKLYAVDIAENGRQLTRCAILPLAESILIREPFYLARLARSPEVQRRIRKRLNVRHSRGDILKRRFLSRFRLRLWNWSLQIDMRTSDWSSVLVTTISVIVPKRWRGHRKDRAVREAIIHAVNMAAASGQEYDTWVSRFEELNGLALAGTLHSTSLDEIQRIIQS